MKGFTSHDLRNTNASAHWLLIAQVLGGVSSQQTENTDEELDVIVARLALLQRDNETDASTPADELLNTLVFDQYEKNESVMQSTLAHHLLKYTRAHHYLKEDLFERDDSRGCIGFGCSAMPLCGGRKRLSSLEAVIFRHFKRTAVEVAILSRLLRDKKAIDGVCAHIESVRSEPDADESVPLNSATVEANSNYTKYEDFLRDLISGYSILSESQFKAKGEFFQPLVQRYLTSVLAQLSAVRRKRQWLVGHALSQFVKKNQGVVDHLIKKFNGRPSAPKLKSGPKHITKAKAQLAKARSTSDYRKLNFYVPEVPKTEQVGYGGAILSDIEAEHRYLSEIAAILGTRDAFDRESNLIDELQPTDENVRNLYGVASGPRNIASLKLMLMFAVSGGVAHVAVTPREEIMWAQYEIIRALSAFKPSVLLTCNQALIDSADKKPFIGDKLVQALTKLEQSIHHEDQPHQSQPSVEVGEWLLPKAKIKSQAFKEGVVVSGRGPTILYHDPLVNTPPSVNRREWRLVPCEDVVERRRPQRPMSERVPTSRNVRSARNPARPFSDSLWIPINHYPAALESVPHVREWDHGAEEEAGSLTRAQEELLHGQLTAAMDYRTVRDDVIREVREGDAAYDGPSGDDEFSNGSGSSYD